jgi:hypothetical protein
VKRLFILALLCSPLWAQTRVQHNVSLNNFSGSTSINFVSSNTVGDGLVLWIAMEGVSGGVGTVNAVSDAAGNTYTYVNNVIGSTGCPPSPANCINFYIYYVGSCKSAGAGNTVTVTFTGVTSQSALFIAEYSSSLTVDATSTWQQTGGANHIATGSATATGTDLIVGFDDFEFQSSNNGDPTTSQSASPTWTELNNANSGSVGLYASSWDLLNASAGSYSNTFTVASSNRSQAGGMIAFTLSGGGSSSASQIGAFAVGP